MLHDIGQDDVGRNYFVGLYRPGCLLELPWGEEQFDCIVFLCSSGNERELHFKVAEELVNANDDWIQVAGTGAEIVHDIIDETSVAIGRQHEKGDGWPMTTWHEEATTAEAMAEVVKDNFGSCGNVLVLVLGNDLDLHTSVNAIKICLNNGY